MINKLKSLIFFFLNPKIKLNSKFLKRKYSQKLNIANIGSAGENDFSDFFWKKIDQYCKFYSFDPDKKKIKKHKNISIFPIGLWSKKTSRNIYLTKFSYASSLFKPNKNNLKKFINYETHLLKDKKKISLDKLDNIIKKPNLCDFIKIDAEGSELEILKGSNKNLKNSLGVEVEINFLKKNIGSPKASQIINYLENNGFELYILNRESWRKNKENYLIDNHQIIWADAVFFKNTNQLEKIILKKNFNKKKIYNFIILLMQYKLYDTALFYINFFLDKKIIHQNEFFELKKFIKLNIQSKSIIMLRNLLLFVICILVFPVIVFLPKFFNSYKNLFKILFRRQLILILNLIRFSGPFDVSKSDNFK